MIPKIIHQTWKNETIPDNWKSYHDSWKKHFPEPEYKHILWTDKDNREFIKQNYNWFLDTFDNYPKNIQRADAIRYFILYHYGGIYADLDCEVRENFYQYLDQNNINLAESIHSNEKRNTMNHLMASNKNNEKWKKVFTNLEKKKKLGSTIQSTGPAILNVLKDENINVLGCKDFNPLKRRSWWRHTIENTFFTTLDEEKIKHWDSAKVVHHSSESWYTEEAYYYIKTYGIFILIILIVLYLLYKKFSR